MTINELAKRADVTTRTIRYYVEQGVLPPPERGRPAEYTEEHVQRLALIRRLKEQYLPLEEIRDMLQRLSGDQLESLLVEPAPPPEQARSGPLTSATDYITNVLHRAAARDQLKRQATSPPVPLPPAWTAPGGSPASQPPGAPLPGPPAPGAPQPEWVPPTPLAPPAAPAPAPFTPQWPANTPMRRVEPIVPAPPQYVTSPGGSAYSSQTQQASTWQRIPLAPGVELHYQVGTDPWLNEVVDRLVEAAGQILESVPEKAVEEP